MSSAATESVRAVLTDALSAVARGARDVLFRGRKPPASRLLDSFSEEVDLATSLGAGSQWQQQLFLALVAFAVLLAGHLVNSLLGVVAANVRRRRVAQQSGGEIARQKSKTAVRLWPAGHARAPRPRSTWADADLLVGEWSLDNQASEAQDGLFDLLDYGWRERLSASYLTDLVIEEDQRTWRIIVLAAGGLSGAVLNETYPKNGATVLVPRRDMPSDESDQNDGDSKNVCEARAAPLQGGVEVRHIMRGGVPATLREWFGVALEEDGTPILVRDTHYELSSGGGKWHGVLVYRPRWEHDPAQPSDTPPVAAPLTRDASTLLEAARTRVSVEGDGQGEGDDAAGLSREIGAPYELGNAIADDCGRWDEVLLNAALRRVNLLPEEDEEQDEMEVEPAPGDNAEGEVEEELGPSEPPTAIVALADALLATMPRTFGGIPAREMTEEEKALLASVEQLGQLRITVEQAEALRATGENPTAPPVPQGSLGDRQQLAAWLEARRTRMR